MLPVVLVLVVLFVLSQKSTKVVVKAPLTAQRAPAPATGTVTQQLTTAAIKAAPQALAAVGSFISNYGNNSDDDSAAMSDDTSDDFSSDYDDDE